MTKRLAIVGASHFQNPLIEKAKEMGCETHVFAWECGDVGEKTADFFYPISIIDKNAILEECRRIGIDGICSIGSDLANIAVGFVASELNLVCNSVDAIYRSTNKHAMRETFAVAGDPSPWSVLAREGERCDISDARFPIIVKPVDRSGSRGITKLTSSTGLQEALQEAYENGFRKEAVVEQYVTGEEFSVEFASWKGCHTFLALTKKYTTGAPHFIETGHLEPAQIDDALCVRISETIKHALNSLGIEYGASHAEVMVDETGSVWIVEIGSRMGGDCIGSDLVRLSTGIDYVGAVVDIALGEQPDLAPRSPGLCAAVRFVLDGDDLKALDQMKHECPECLEFVSPIEDFSREVMDSSTRFGYFIMKGADYRQLARFLPGVK